MALIPSLLLVLGSVVAWWARGRSIRAGQWAPIAASAAAVLLGGSTLQATTTIALWSPTAVFGPGLSFRLDAFSAPFLMLGCSAVLAFSALRAFEASPGLLAGLGLAVAAAVAADPGAVAVSWTVLSLAEAILVAGGGGRLDRLDRGLRPQLAAAVLVVGPGAPVLAASSTLGAGLLVAAMLLRSIPISRSPEPGAGSLGLLRIVVVLSASGLLLRDPPAGANAAAAFRQAAVAAAVAAQLAAAARFLADREWVGGTVLAAGGIASLLMAGPTPAGLAIAASGLVIGMLRAGRVRVNLSRPALCANRPAGTRLQRLANSVAGLFGGLASSIRFGTELLEGQSAVLWMFLALLAIAIAGRGGPT